MKRLSPPLYTLLITSASYLIFGIFNAALGPVLGELSTQTGASLAAVGIIFTALFSGSLLAQLTSGALTDRYGRALPFIISIVLFAAGIFGITRAESLPALMAFGFLAGSGQGGVDLGANLLVADAYRKNAAAALNILHVTFNLGSAMGPALISLSLVRSGHGLPVIYTAAILFGLLATLAIFSRMKSVVEPARQASTGAAGRASAIEIYRSPVVWLLGFLLLLIVGAEFGIGSWSAIYMNQSAAMSKEAAALVTSGYWAMMTVGRLAVAALSRWIAPVKILLACLVISVIGNVGIALTHGLTAPSTAAFIFTGLGYGGLYPLVITTATAAFPTGSGKAASVIVAMGTIGGLLIPSLAGVALDQYGTSPYTWLIVLIMGGALLIGFLFWKTQVPAGAAAEV